MDIKKFTEILTDENLYNFEKMSHKYRKRFELFLENLKDLYYEKLPLFDESGNNIVFINSHAKLSQNTVKLLLKNRDEGYGIKAAEDEIISTCAIENIDFSRDSVRNILKGYAPKDEQENRIMGLKKGFEFICTNNEITEENLYKLYMMTVGEFLSEEDKLPSGNLYRHDDVFVVSDRIEHTGISAKKVPSYMKQLIGFINAKDEINDLYKAAIIHFYFCFVHPYFDGNGRMARLLHLWFLIRKGYKSALFIPFSSKIEKTRKKYYGAYTTIESNKKYNGVLDVTPFVLYFTENVYNKINSEVVGTDTFEVYENALSNGQITEKETKLWKFVLSYYGTGEFSTKQLEKDFGDAAYATIRGFVLKFEKLGLLYSTKYGARIKYKVV